MGERTAQTLTGRFVQGAQDVIDIPHVELRALGSDLVSPSPTGLALRGPIPLVGRELGEAHAGSLARAG